MRHAVLFAGRILLALGISFSSFLQAHESGASAVGPSIPFELRSGFLIVVTAQVGDLHGSKFILDTGASYTFIDQKVADRLKLRRRSGKITSLNRDVPVELAESRTSGLDLFRLVRIRSWSRGSAIIPSSRKMWTELSGWICWAEARGAWDDCKRPR